MHLPMIAVSDKWKVAGVWYLSFALFYTLTGRFHLRAPSLLKLSRVDRTVPFLPSSVWVYQTHVPFVFFAIWVIQDRAALSRTFYAMYFASFFAFSIFAVYPTVFPRKRVKGDDATSSCLKFLHSIDRPTNCFPSLHVTLALILALGVIQFSPVLGAVFGLWALLIILSTMTTKQHYFADVVGGLCLALISWATFR